MAIWNVNQFAMVKNRYGFVDGTLSLRGLKAESPMGG